MSDERLYGADALFQIPLVTRGAVDFYAKPSTPVIAAGDLKLKTDRQIRANTTAKILGFDSGSVEPSAGDTVVEATGDGSAVVMFVVVVSGTWVGGDAAGFMFVKTVTGTWTDNIDINNSTTSQTNFATVDAGTTGLYSASQLAATAGLYASDGVDWYVALTATEMACQWGNFNVIDQTGTKLWEDQAGRFETDGHYLALHKTGYDGGLVWIDPDAAVGPYNGTVEHPVNSIIDAYTIAAAIGSYRIKFKPPGKQSSSYTIPSTFQPTKIHIDLNGWFIARLERLEFDNFAGTPGEYLIESSSTRGRLSSNTAPAVIPNSGTLKNIFVDVSIQNDYGYYEYCEFKQSAGDTRYHAVGATHPDLSFWQCAFGGNLDTAWIFDFTGVASSNVVRLHDCWGHVRLQNSSMSNSVVFEYLGWGSIIIDDSCLAGMTVRHSSHVKVYAEDGISAYSGAVTTELISQSNQTDLDWADGGRLDVILDAVNTNAAAILASAHLLSTTIATLASQTSFTLTAGSADDDAYNDCTVVVTDVSTATQKAVGLIKDYTGSTKTVTLLADPGIFTMAATDLVTIFRPDMLNRYIAATAAGDIANAGEDTESFTGLDKATTRVSATVDASGNRTNTYT